MNTNLHTEVADLLMRLAGTDQQGEAYDALQTFRRRGLLIAAAAAELDEKTEMVAAARVMLRDTLRELVTRLPRPQLFE